MSTRKLRASEYWSVLDKHTGLKIVDCGDEQDARGMQAFDPENRIITKNRLLAGPVVDVEVRKELPTSAVVRAPRVVVNPTIEPGTGEPVVIHA